MTPQEEKEKAILALSHVIAVVGLSVEETKPSNIVARYLQNAGYMIIPVNPNYSEALGEKCYSSLLDIPVKVDIVDIFRLSENVLPTVREAVMIRPKCIWLQLGIENEEAKKIVEQEGIPFFQNLCIKIEHSRLIGG